LTGPAVRLVEDLLTFTRGGAANFAITAGGALFYVPTSLGIDGFDMLVRVGRDGGNPTPVHTDPLLTVAIVGLGDELRRIAQRGRLSSLFICPAVGCGRRVAILYGGSIFACRYCHRLAYASSREDMSDRTMRRADQLRERLGWPPGILNPNGDKPKWMRWRTFERLREQHDQLVARSMIGLACRLGLN